jgi:hypothetical protein
VNHLVNPDGGLQRPPVDVPQSHDGRAAFGSRRWWVQPEGIETEPSPVAHFGGFDTNPIGELKARIEMLPQ